MLPLAFIAVTATAELESPYERSVRGARLSEEQVVGTAPVSADVWRMRPPPSRAPRDDDTSTRVVHTDVWADVVGGLRTEPAIEAQSTAATSQTGNGPGLPPDATAQVGAHLTQTASTLDEPCDAVRATADHRIRLLAKRYGGRLTPEEDARLGILSARLDELVPQVTDEDRAALTELRAAQARVMAGVDELLASLDV